MTSHRRSYNEAFFWHLKFIVKHIRRPLVSFLCSFSPVSRSCHSLRWCTSPLYIQPAETQGYLKRRYTQNIPHKYKEGESVFNFLLFNSRRSSNFLTLFNFKREGGGVVSELHIKRMKLRENWRLLWIKGWELVRAEHFTEEVHNNSKRKQDLMETQCSLCAVYVHVHLYGENKLQCV